ncbi:MAG: hypothetical protein AB8H79_06940 [Myxococcota bacterium]
MAQSSAGVLPPVDTWHPQVRRWVHAAWEQAGGLEGGSLSLANVVRALWAAGDPWSRAYRHLFAGAPAPATRPIVVMDDDVFYAGDADLVSLMEDASRLGAGRVHPWAMLGLIAERTARSAQPGNPGVDGVRSAPVEASGEGTVVRAQRGATAEHAMEWGGGRQVIAIVVDDRLSSDSERYATPYVQGQFHMLAGRDWVLREPGTESAFWVMEGVSPDAAASLPEALREARRRVPGFLPWLPLKAGIPAERAPHLDALLAPLRTLPRLLLTTDAGARPGEEEADTLIVALDAATGGSESAQTEPILADHPDETDALGHAELAAGLVGTLAHPQTPLPLHLAVLGPTGSGRSDLMARLHAQWLTHDPPQQDDEDAHPPLRAVRVNAARLDGALEDVIRAALVEGTAAPKKRETAFEDPLSDEATAAVPVRASMADQALALVLPGAHSEAPRSAKAQARAGLISASLGAAGVLAAPPDWTAFVPALLLGVGGWLLARGIGSGVLGDIAEEAPTPKAPPIRSAPTPTQLPCERLMVLVDDLDRASPAQARALLKAVSQLDRHDDLPDMVVIIACSSAVLHAACPPQAPATTLIQVPVWLTPMRARRTSRALAAWTGLPAPRVPSPPRLVAVTEVDDSKAADPVPIQVEADDPGELGPADLDALLAFERLVPPQPRAWKRVLNQARLLRPHAAGTPANAIAAWLSLAAACPDIVLPLRDRLHSGVAVVELLAELLPDDPRLVAVPTSAWPDAAPLADAADTVLRWTFVGPYAHSDQMGEVRTSLQSPTTAQDPPLRRQLPDRHSP